MKDFGDDWAVLGAPAGVAVVDEVTPGGSGVLDEDLAFEVGDGDLICVDDDKDVLEAALFHRPGA